MRAAQILSFVARRVLQAIPTLVGIAILNFLLLQLAPGDLASVLAGESGGSSREYIDEIRQKFGLDQPIYIQLLAYLKNLAMGDFGYSARNNEAVSTLIFGRLGPTLMLTATAFVLALILGIVLGAISSRRIHSIEDNVISVLSMVFYAMPLFWIGLMLILVFSVWLRWLPVAGMEDVAAFYSGFDRVRDIAWHLVLPATTLGLFYVAVYTRMTRAAMIDQKDMDYVTTARAKGISESRITVRHVFPNAVLPVITMAGVQLGTLFGGSIVVETVFAWPGLGTLAYQALFARDLNLLLGIFLLCACMVVVANILIDVLYALIDKRIAMS